MLHLKINLLKQFSSSSRDNATLLTKSLCVFLNINFSVFPEVFYTSFVNSKALLKKSELSKESC